MQAKVFQSDFRMLNEDELVYKISNRKNVQFDSESSFGDIVNQLTPGRMEIALAAVELYTRKKARNNLREKIHSSTDVYRIMQPIMVNQEVEELWAIYMNMASRIVKMKRISVGGIAQTLVDIRILLKEALLCNAVAMTICHNHPSGNVRPSSADDQLTEKISKACKTMDIRFLDHLIIADDTYYSYADEGRLY
jgi:DNA repair protein RadC